MMTEQEKREKVIKGLEFTLEEAGWDTNAAYDQELMIQAVTNAIALLKAQEPCEDAVSRKKVLDEINAIENDGGFADYGPYARLFDYVDTMPSVAPKAEEPRVMTFAEVKQHYNLPPVFTDDLDMQEDYYQDIRPLYFEFPNSTPWDVHWRRSNHVRTYLEEWEDRYNITWRVWTSRPTDAQREATPWP